MSSALKDVFLYFANGLILKAKSFGAEGSFVGEVVFNTSMSGYQEIITDPSYAGQFVAFSMPEIGINGTNNQDIESTQASCTGIIVSSYNDFVSNFRSQGTLAEYLKIHQIMGICGVDVRGLIQILRERGSMMMIASTLLSEAEQLKELLESTPTIQEINYIPKVSTKNAYTHRDSVFDFSSFAYGKPASPKAKVVAIDFGIKRNILNELVNVGLEVEVVPHTFQAKAIVESFKRGEVQGVFLSNGPGDPLMLTNEVERLRS